MEEVFEVKFASSEKEFIYNSGVNRGHTSVPLKVTRCLFLSDGAKSLYTHLSAYAYGDKRECFPGQSVLKMELGWENQKFDKYLNELREVGLIKTVRRAGRSLLYLLEELHQVTILVFSELVYQVFSENRGDDEKFRKAVKEFKKSDLFSKVIGSVNPIIHKDPIHDWFASYMKGDEQPTSIEETPKPKPTAIPGVFSLDEDVKSVKDPDKQPSKKKKGSTFRELSVDEWNAHHFWSYFEDKYIEKYKLPPASKYMAEVSALKTLVNVKKDKQVVKTHIDNYFDLDHFDGWSRSVFSFSSAAVQQKLDHYLNFGSLTSYKSSTGKQSTVTKIDGDKEWIDENEDW